MNRERRWTGFWTGFVCAALLVAALAQARCATVAGLGRDITGLADGVGKEIGRQFSKEEGK